MRYRMIAVDLDGTLLNRDGEVSAVNRRALQRAVDAGVLVVPCTGRSWIESRQVIDQVQVFCDGLPGVFVTGAMVQEVGSGHVLDLARLPGSTIGKLVDVLSGSGESLLIFRDREVVGHDYLIVGQREIDPNTRWWFEVNGLLWERTDRAVAEDFDHAVRLQVVGTRERAMPLHEQVMAHVADDIYAHCFEAVQMPEPTDNIYILEVFAAGVDKWRGLRWLAESHDITVEQVAAIGDEINDLHMLEAAGCSIAMGNAVDAAKAAAMHITEDRDDDGVARAIDRLLDGEW